MRDRHQQYAAGPRTSHPVRAVGDAIAMSGQFLRCGLTLATMALISAQSDSIAQVPQIAEPSQHALFSFLLSAQQTDPTDSDSDDHPDMESVVNDRFTTDTRDNYTIDGNATWQPGLLTLDAGTSLEKAIDAESRVKVDLSFERQKATSSQPTWEMCLWFLPDGATNCFVRLRSTLTQQGTEASVALVDTGQQDGRQIQQVVRSVQLNDQSFQRIGIEYRYGLVTVSADNTDILTAHIENADATIKSVRAEARSVARMTSLLVVAAPVDSYEPSAQEQKQLAEAQADNANLVRLYRQGHAAEAAEIGKRVLQTRRSILGDEHFLCGTSYHNLAVISQELGRYADAEEFFNQALRIRRRHFGKMHPHYAVTLNSLAAVYDTTGNVPGAVAAFTEALGIDRVVHGEDHPNYASTLNNFANVYFSMGDFRQAESMFRRAAEIRLSVLGDSHPDYALSLNSLASLYGTLGDYDRAKPLFEQSMTIWKAALGAQHPTIGHSLNNLANLHRDMGRYDRARQLLEEAARINLTQFDDRHPAYARSLNDLGLLSVHMGDFRQAEQLIRQAMEIRLDAVGAQHPDYAQCLNDLAFVYRKMGDDERAEPLYQQALEIRKSSVGVNHPDYARSMNNLAAVCMSRNDFSRAESLYRQAIQIKKSAFGDTHPSYANGLYNLAVMYAQKGEATRAEPLFRQSIEIEKRAYGQQHDGYAKSLNNLAALYSSMRQYDRAEELFDQAAAIVRQGLDRNAFIQSERQQFLNQTAQRTFLDRRLANAIHLDSDASPVLQAVWQWKGAVTARQQAYRRVAGNPELAPAFDKLTSVSQQLSALLKRLPPVPAASAPESEQKLHRDQLSRWTTRFRVLTQERESLQQQIAADSREFRQVVDPVTVEEVQSWLPPRTAFVDFLEYTNSLSGVGRNTAPDQERRLMAFVVTKERPVAMIDIGPVIGLADAIERFRRPFAEATTSAQHEEAARLAGQQLRANLWIPVQNHLDGIETVIISPDTVLGTLPFAALPGHTNGRYLIDEYRFASIPYAGMLRTILEESDDRVPAEKGLLVVGDVNYEANPLVAQTDVPADEQPAWLRRSAPRVQNSQWKSLPGFEDELGIVRDRFESQFGGGVTILRRDNATEREFMRLAPQHYNLHIVTHGFFADSRFDALSHSADAPSDLEFSRDTGSNSQQAVNRYLPGLLSGLVMAGANQAPPEDDPDADGILTASEIETLNLNRVDLAVLSACETGLGKVAAGEGLTGLQRAFHIAGVRSCLATLWAVEDKATQELMARFYRNYWHRGQSKIDALRNAQLEILNDVDLVRGTIRDLKASVQRPGPPKSRRADPRYWGAFQLSGDWR